MNEVLVFSSPFVYCALVYGVLYMRKRGMLGDVKKQFVTWHNYVMAAQSVWLLGTLGVFYTKVAAHYNLSWMNFYSVSMQDSTVVDMFVLTHATFVGFKVWEWLDTVILALNDKPIILLHWWHHATIVIAFYTGVYSSANFWIGFVNSFIHVVMYLYYADVTWIKPFAKYITQMQMIQLAGGIFFTACGMWMPGKYYNALIMLINASYLVLFGVFYFDKYSSGKAGAKNEAKSATANFSICRMN